MSPAHERLHALWLARWPVHAPGLVAFVVPRAGAEAECDTESLRQWLAKRLPDALLPQRIVIAGDLPRTPAGKLDRHALRLPGEAPATSRRSAVAPRTDTESRLAAFFEQVLGVAPESVEDDFFAELGGHSLVATQLASLIRREWPIAFELRSVFEHPTVEGLAAHIERAQQGGVLPRKISPRQR